MDRSVATLDPPAGRLIVTGFGRPASLALTSLLRHVRRGDPLAPVEVVVPSGVAGVTVRRAVAGNGLANVRFSALPQLAARLAAVRLGPERQPARTTTVRAAAVRLSLLQGSGSLSRFAEHHRTVGLLEGVFGELDDADPDDAALVRISDASGSGAQIVALYRGYRQLLSGYRSERDVTLAATATVAEGAAPMGPVVLYAARRLAPAERDLVRTLARVGRLHAVAAVTVDPHSDADPNDGNDATGSGELTRWLQTLLPDVTWNLPDPVHASHIEVAPDAEEEVRLATRRVLARLGNGVAPHRIALAFGNRVPYARLIGEQFAAADIPHHGSATGTLAGSVTGRVLAGLLHLPTEGYSREAVLQWLRGGPVLDGDGARVPVGRWERLSREAGIARGVQQWRQRLDRLAEQARRRANRGPADESARQRHERRLADVAALQRFFDDLVAGCARVSAAATWSEAAATLHSLVTGYLGPAAVRDRWGQDSDASPGVAMQHVAHEAVLAAVAALSVLDAMRYPAPTPAALRQVLDAELDRPLPSATTLGRGVTVGPIGDIAGADFDTVIVLGMTESAFPARLRENPLLRDAERAAGDCDLALVADRRRTERETYLAAVTAGQTTVLSFPRADLRSQRAQHPAPWLLEAATARHGSAVSATELGDAQKLPGRDVAHWLTRHDSFESALHTASVAASVHEYDVRLALGGAGAVLASVDPRYGRGRDAVVARRDGRFGPWLGGIAPLPPTLVERADTVLSATSLQTWATCPRTFLLKHLLQVRALDDPVDEERMSAMDRGSLVHAVLEEFFGAALNPPKPPHEPWTPADLVRARTLLDQQGQELADAGRAGRPLLWQAQLARLHRQLTTMLTVDTAIRARQGSWPVAVEDPFGRHDQPPLVLALEVAGPVSFSGSIDRVDATYDGRLIVVDYKTGKGYGYDNIPAEFTPVDGADLVDRGRKLQLMLYALAARNRHGDADTPVQSWFWFVEQGALRRGKSVTATDERRLLHVLDVSVSGIRAGTFPARPGEAGWKGWDNCGFCAYDRGCPTTRGESWEHVRSDPTVAGYATLAETGRASTQGEQ